MLQRLFHFIQEDTGATAVEYSILAVAIAAAIVAIVYTLGGNTESSFSNLNDTWEGLK